MPVVRAVPPCSPTHRRIGLAVSGGADSTALLVLMAELRHELDFDAFVLHVDHGLRPDSADDAKFVKQLAIEYGLPFHSVRAHIVRRPRESLEMAARRVRLDFFAKMTRRLRLDAIATGHHADDVAETFILRLARGSGPDGLAGLKRISHVDSLTFIRPLLDLRDTDLRRFLTERGIAWREDSTNTDTSIQRNHVRHVVLPWLRANLDPHITEHLCKSAAILRGDLTRDDGVLNGRDALLRVRQPSVLNGRDALLRVRQPSVRHGGGRAGARPSQVTEATLCSFKLSISPATGFTRTAQSIGALPAICELSRAALAGRTLALRTWAPGDRIAPTGMHGRSRKLQDVFVTAKVPAETRVTLPVLVDAATNEVLWVPGYRVAESAAVESLSAPSWRFTLELDKP